MTDNELLLAISNIMEDKLQSGLRPIRSDLEEVKADQKKMRSDLEEVKEDQEKLKQRVVNMALILENETNHNIQLLAENHINLVDKLNQAIRVGDKNMLLEIQISGQKMRIDKLEEEVARIKENIA